MTRAELHRLVEELPEDSVEAVGTVLRRAQDPVIAKLDAAPYDDERLTGGELRAVRAARREPGVAWSEAEAELNAG
jgi:hypothetical protein